MDGTGCVDGMGVMGEGIADGTVGTGFTSFAITAAADNAIAAVISAVIENGEIFFKDVIVLLKFRGLIWSFRTLRKSTQTHSV